MKTRMNDTTRSKTRLSLKMQLFLTGLSFLLFSILVIVIWAFGIEPGLLTVTRWTLSDTDLPDSWDGRVIVFFSDIHAGPNFDIDRVNRVSDAIMAEKPALILFGGDLIDSRTPKDPAFAEALSNALSGMQAPFGCFAVLGNHDNRLAAERRLCRKILEDGGFRLLVNESVQLDGLLLGGMDESFFGDPDLDKTFADSLAGGENDWRLLLMHQPDYAAALFSREADQLMSPAALQSAARLILSGHSHGGQVTFFGSPVHTPEQGHDYTYGLYEMGGGRRLLVTRGLGTMNIGARFCAPPEIMVITLQRG